MHPHNEKAIRRTLKLRAEDKPEGMNPTPDNPWPPPIPAHVARMVEHAEAVAKAGNPNAGFTATEVYIMVAIADCIKEAFAAARPQPAGKPQQEKKA